MSVIWFFIRLGIANLGFLSWYLLRLHFESRSFLSSLCVFLGIGGLFVYRVLGWYVPTQIASLPQITAALQNHNHSFSEQLFTNQTIQTLATRLNTFQNAQPTHRDVTINLLLLHQVLKSSPLTTLPLTTSLSQLDPNHPIVQIVVDFPTSSTNSTQSIGF